MTPEVSIGQFQLCILSPPPTRAFFKVCLLNTIVEKNIPWTLKLLFCINFILTKPCLKFPKSAVWIFGLKMTPLPPLALFRKFIRFGAAILPILVKQALIMKILATACRSSHIPGNRARTWYPFSCATRISPFPQWNIGHHFCSSSLA